MLLRRSPPVDPLPPFTGSHGFPVRSLVALAELRMESEPRYFKRSNRKIAYLTSSFTGRANLWISNQFEQALSPQSIFKTYEGFKRMLLCYFEHHDTKLGQVIHCEQNGTVIEYAERWSEVMENLEDDMLRRSEMLAAIDPYGRLRVSVAEQQSAQMDMDTRYWRLWWIYGLDYHLQQPMLQDFPKLRTFIDVVARAVELEQRPPTASVSKSKAQSRLAPRMSHFSSWVSKRLSSGPTAHTKGASTTAIDALPAGASYSKDPEKRGRRFGNVTWVVGSSALSSETMPLLSSATRRSHAPSPEPHYW